MPAVKSNGRLRSAEEIAESSRLRDSTYIKYSYTAVFKKELLATGEEILFKPMALRTIGNLGEKPYEYRPDFLFNRLTVDGRPIIIDTLPTIKVSYLREIKAIRKAFGLYAVLASPHNMYTSNHLVGARILDHVDEYWRIERDGAGKLTATSQLALQANLRELIGETERPSGARTNVARLLRRMDENPIEPQGINDTLSTVRRMS